MYTSEELKAVRATLTGKIKDTEEWVAECKEMIGIVGADSLYSDFVKENEVILSGLRKLLASLPGEGA